MSAEVTHQFPEGTRLPPPPASNPHQQGLPSTGWGVLNDLSSAPAGSHRPPAAAARRCPVAPVLPPA